MPALTASIILGVGLAASAAGAGLQYSAAKSSASAQESAIAAQQQAEAQRRQQMELDAMRRRREIVRQTMQARSVALATATAQGAQSGSALAGATGQISGRSGVNMLGVNQNEQIGENIFSANQGLLQAYRSSAAAGVTGALGAGISGVGGALMKNNESLSKIGTFAVGKLGF